MKGVFLGLFLSPTVLLAVPPNDDFAKRITIRGDTNLITGNNQGATSEPGEPAGHYDHSLWWAWQAPLSGVAYLTAIPGRANPALDVFLGDSLGSLQRVSTIAGGAGTSSLAFAATQGTSYQISVCQHLPYPDTPPGDFALSQVLHPRPPSDHFVDRSLITEMTNVLTTTNTLLVAAVEGTTRYATKEAGETLWASVLYDASVWWSWIAPVSGRVTVRATSGSFSPKVAVCRGSAVTNLTKVLDDAPADDQVLFDAIAGTRYEIGVDDDSGESTFGRAGEFVLQLSEIPVPANDLFADRIVLAGSSLSVTGTALHATKEVGEPLHGTNTISRRSIWWAWTAPEDGSATFTLAALSTAPFVELACAVYTGEVLTNLTLVTKGTGLHGATIAFNALAGMTYQVAVDGYRGASGTVWLALTPGGPPALAARLSQPGALALEVLGEAGQWVTLQASTNLVTWTPLTSLFNSNGTLRVIPPAAADSGSCFFRLMVPP